ncbi:hypothetical protein [Actinomyces naeslundii]|uniref:hypothetical protein n=1 Tax=Actinomyces naeslundii TaxID=1655 RepID=UPI00096DFD8D|nr:hypothetical protein [Actinomyces naeslundii]OMG21149.1 hypothetical protein BKH37_10860 [Actinomyces naeslundii]OMG28378.1 hypothetical protein BKH35_07370 [Actinomyces naeslundii]OMG41242.1 hypothetical protein BKH14_01265 [Actinomyces naeslundii]
MSAATQHHEIPAGPEEALAVVDAQRSTYLKRHEIKAAPLLTAWGLAWLVGYAALALYREPDYDLPRVPYLFFCGCLAAALLFTFAYIIPKARGVRGRSSREGTYCGLAWTLGMSLGAVILSRLNVLLAAVNTGQANEVASVVSNAVPCLVVGVIFLMSAALWDETVMGVLGGWILLITLVVTIAGMPWAWWIMSVAGGGGMLVAAVVSVAMGTKRGV